MTDPTLADLPCPLRAAALARPDDPALVGPGGVTTYAALDGAVTATAGRLRAAGLADGARVALYLPNGEDYVVLLLALLRSGAVACPLSTRVPPSALGPLAAQVAARALVTDDVAADVPCGRVDPEALLAYGPEEEEEVRLGRDRAATVVFTTGSTGRPKAALHTFGNHYYSAAGSNRNLPLSPGDRWWLSLPLYHVGGLGIVFRCLLAGAAVALPPRAASVEEALGAYGITHASMVSTQLLRLLRERPAGVERLRAVLLGGSAIPAGLLEEAVAARLPVHTSYGLTETASQVTATPPGAGREALGTSGRPLPFRRLRIAADGEILVRGETLFAGYVEGERVERPSVAGGWFPTGDLGRLDAEGRLVVTGRKDHRFVSGGENVQPEEVEQALERLPGVVRAVVVPVEDETYGQRPVAFVETGPARPGLAGLADELAPVLPRFKIPVAFLPWPEDAAAERMKVDRQALRLRAAGRARGGGSANSL